MSTALPPDLQQFVDHEVAAGRYGSEGELVIDAVRQLRDAEQDLARFKAQLQERIAALDRGEGIVLESDEQLGEFLDQIDREVNEELARQQGRLAS